MTDAAPRIPTEVTVRVYTARNLQKEVTGYVSIKLGRDKFKTGTSEKKARPDWNEECVLKVKDPRGAIKVQLNDKGTGDIVGLVRWHVAELPTSPMGRKWIPLHPKKVKTINNIAPSALGEICVEMFISKTADAALHAEHHRKWPSFKVKGGSDKVDKSLSTSSNSLHPPDGSNLQRSNSSTSVATVAATPIAAPLDASSRRSSQVNIETPPPSTKKDSSKRVSVVGEAASAAASAQSGPAPEISGVSPKECTVAGGVRVIVKGSKLGTNTDDIATVRFGDNDALSVEWISSSKVAVVTPPRNKAGKVPVTIILRDGRNGGGSNFTYREDPNADHSVSNGHAKESSSPSAAAAAGGGFETPSYPATTADENYDAMSRPRLIAEIQKLKEENIKIMDTNAAMKEYIDALIIKMLEMDVDALEKR